MTLPRILWFGRCRLGINSNTTLFYRHKRPLFYFTPSPLRLIMGCGSSKVQEQLSIRAGVLPPAKGASHLVGASGWCRTIIIIIRKPTRKPDHPPPPVRQTFRQTLVDWGYHENMGHLRCSKGQHPTPTVIQCAYWNVLGRRQWSTDKQNLRTELPTLPKHKTPPAPDVYSIHRYRG